MAQAGLDTFLNWGETVDGEFPDLQYTHEDTITWDQLLDEYLDPFPFDPPTGTEIKVEGIDEPPELSPASTHECEIQALSHSVSELKDRLDGLEDRIAEKQKYVYNLPDLGSVLTRKQQNPGLGGLY
ncbi:hypothetical protein N7540_005581 [Penicillium herquei]|nr:hypothetical protein N7540_005581 [Penicillium herquei]